MRGTLSILLLGAFCAACVARAQDPPPSAKLRVRFLPVVDGRPLERGRQYSNPFGEPYTVERLRFYSGQWQFFPKSPGDAMNPGYFLFDSEDSLSSSITFTLAPGRYDSLSFLLGVDSLYNVSGAQTGALDPIKGMFWTWRTGYVMARLEGSSPLSSLPRHRFEYHIGGFEGIHKVVRTLHLGLPSGPSLFLRPGSVTEILITADCNAWFRGAQEIRIAATPSCTEPGPLARAFSENYADMFRIKEVIP